MHHQPALDLRAQVWGQGLVGEILVREGRVAAAGRDFPGVQDRRGHRRFPVRHVRVPDRLAVAEVAERRSVPGLQVRDHQDFGILVEIGLADDAHSRRLQLAEPLAEGDQLRIAQVLVPDQHDEMVVIGLPDALERLAGELRQVDASDLRSQSLSRRHDLERHRLRHVFGAPFRTVMAGVQCSTRATPRQRPGAAAVLAAGGFAGYNRLACRRSRYHGTGNTAAVGRHGRGDHRGGCEPPWRG